jgi:UDP-N-acetylmuramoyl-L-alanyl-D-glutamate--2,6-diaminopimelate ligase
MGASRQPVSLHRLAAAVAGHQPVDVFGEDTAVVDVHLDSRRVGPGTLFVAIRGANVDGHDFIPQAVAAGAAALAVEEAPGLDIPHLIVSNTREALGWLAAEVHGHPADRLGLIGITGTNGKTTVAHMLADILEGAGRGSAVIGTVSANLDDAGEASPRTTPEASDLHRMLRRLVDRGEVTDVAMEVSSHAMTMGRLNGVRFDVVAFTNLSQDHLDYHHTMEEYFAAKARLFAPQWAPQAVIWTDDPWGRRLAGESAIPVTAVGTEPGCDVVVTLRDAEPSGSTFLLEMDGTVVDVAVSLAGEFNVANAAVAITCAVRHGIPLEQAATRLATMPAVPGRFNTVPAPGDRWVVIDYAHTPDAIRRIIDQARLLTAGRVIVVGGAGGDRDREKRPLMGAALGAADLTIITSDNPRSESPEAIADQVMSGIDPGRAVVRELDRRAAIRIALAESAPGDAILVLGKGHETGQEFSDRVVPFEDRLVVVEEFSAIEGGEA